jgi:hypothetical protein
MNKTSDYLTQKDIPSEWAKIMGLVPLAKFIPHLNKDLLKMSKYSFDVDEKNNFMINGVYLNKKKIDTVVFPILTYNRKSKKMAWIHNEMREALCKKVFQVLSFLSGGEKKAALESYISLFHGTVDISMGDHIKILVLLAICNPMWRLFRLNITGGYLYGFATLEFKSALTQEVFDDFCKEIEMTMGLVQMVNGGKASAKKSPNVSAKKWRR